MYACTAGTLAMAHGETDLKDQVPKALLEAAEYVGRAGCWADAAGLTEVAMLARAQFLTDPFDFQMHAELESHQITEALQLTAVKKYWLELKPLLATPEDTTGWFKALDAFLETAVEDYQLSEEEYQRAAAEQLNGAVFSDLGPTRVIDFCALGVRWIFTFDNDRATVLSTGGFCAALQVLIQ